MVKGKKYTFLYLVIFILPLGIIADQPKVEDFRDVDNRAINTPENFEQDIFQLTAYLVQPYSNQSKKVRAIYTWIAYHISYDVDSYMNGLYGAVYPEDVLEKRKSVCEGYARLFKKMAEAAGIRAEMIGGYSKGYNYQEGELFSHRNSHAWNAVRIDGQWYLVDVTWGSGYINESFRFIRRFNDYYFLTPPHQLIQSHFPEDVKWQLLERKITRPEFEKSAYAKASFFSYGLQTDSHNQYQITAVESLLVTLINPGDIHTIARLYYGDTELNAMYTFTQNHQNKIEIMAVFPESATYTLRIFAKRKEDPNPYLWIMDYQVQAKRDGRHAMGFVEKYSTFDELNGYLYFPLNRFLIPGDTVKFRLKLDGVQQVVFYSEEKLIPFQRKENIYTGKIHLEKDETIIAVKTNKDNYYHYILRYQSRL